MTDSLHSQTVRQLNAAISAAEKENKHVWVTDLRHHLHGLPQQVVRFTRIGRLLSAKTSVDGRWHAVEDVSTMFIE